MSLATLPEALGLREHPYAYLVGGGGKTTLMFTLARLLAARGCTVITSTSTRIGRPGPERSPAVVVAEEPSVLIEQARVALARVGHVTVARREEAPYSKLHGLGTDVLDALYQAVQPDFLLVEGDGSKGRPLKGHAAYEPVVSSGASMVIAVVGADAVGCPLDEAHVHRAAVVQGLLGLEEGSRLGVADVVRLLEHPEGMLRSVRASVPVAAAVTRAARGPARELAAALAAGSFAPVVACELCGAEPTAVVVRGSHPDRRGAPGKPP